MRDLTQSEVLEVVTGIENALCFSAQALAVMDLWMDSLTRDDEGDCNRLSAIYTLLHEMKSHLEKAMEQSHA